MFASLMEILTVRRSGKARLDPSLTLNSTSHLPAGMPGAFTCLPVWTSLTCSCIYLQNERPATDAIGSEPATYEASQTSARLHAVQRP